MVVITKTDQGAEGHGMTFTLGRGNEIVKAAAESFKPFVLGKNIKEVCPEIKHLFNSNQFRFFPILVHFGNR